MTLTRDDVDAAAVRIAPHVRRTPTVRVDLAGRPLWLKLEHLQVTGSFKARGATNAVLSLDPARRGRRRVRRQPRRRRRPRRGGRRDDGHHRRARLGA